mgnify:CR=1 FL=1
MGLKMHKGININRRIKGTRTKEVNLIKNMTTRNRKVVMAVKVARDKIITRIRIKVKERGHIRKTSCPEE